MAILYALVIGRVSSQKQGLIGDSLSAQEEWIDKRIREIEIEKQCEIKIVKSFPLTKSASSENIQEQPLFKALQFAKQHTPKITLMFVKSIDRETRAGIPMYLKLREEMVKRGITLYDAEGIIDDKRINTLDMYGLNYDWGHDTPSFSEELRTAEFAEKERKKILRKLISAEARYVSLGYWIGPAPYGFKSIKIESLHGLRVTLIPHPNESRFIIKMFELRAKGLLLDYEIVQEINSLGFKTRTKRLHDKDTGKIIGHIGSNTLTEKQLIRYVSDPIYAGINVHQWLRKDKMRKTVLSEDEFKKQYAGLISIDLFNKANKGKRCIVQEGDYYRVLQGPIPYWQQVKKKVNENFPYKQHILCPVCAKPLYGSASRGKSGKYFPLYHCSRNHKYWSISKDKLNDIIEQFTQHIELTDDFMKKFRDGMMKVWEKKRSGIIEDNQKLSQHLTEIESQQKELALIIRKTSSEVARRIYEEELQELEVKRLEVMQRKNKKSDEQIDINDFFRLTYYYLEHLNELLFNRDKPLESAAYFGILFDQRPTVEELKNPILGTPKLNGIFKLSEEYKRTGNLSVSPLSRGWNTFYPLYSTRIIS